MIFNICKRIINVVKNPREHYIHKVQPRVRHYKYPLCDSSAIVNRPLRFSPKGVILGKDVYIYKNARISCIFEYAGESFNPCLEIQEGSTIQQNAHITCAQSIKIGKNCAITHNVTITDIDHTYEYSMPTPPRYNKLKVNSLNIGDNCMIFPNAVILGGTEIGNNCVIAANSVVRGVFPNNCLIGGIPARIIKRLNPETGKWEKTDPKGSFKTKT